MKDKTLGWQDFCGSLVVPSVMVLVALFIKRDNYVKTKKR